LQKIVALPPWAEKIELHPSSKRKNLFFSCAAPPFFLKNAQILLAPRFARPLAPAKFFLSLARQLVIMPITLNKNTT